MSAPLIVLDTGVVVRALLGSEDAASYRLCRAAGTGEVRLAISDRFLTELVGVVQTERVRGSIRDVARAFRIALDIGFHGEHHVFSPLPWPSIQDQKDWWAADLAYVAEADFIVSWDSHLLDARLPISVEVVEPPMLLDRLSSSQTSEDGV